MPCRTVSVPGGGVATFTTRVRASSEPIEFDMHLEDGQIALGFDEAKHGVDEEPDQAGAEA